MKHRLALASGLLAACVCAGAAGAAPQSFENGLSIELVTDDLLSPTGMAFLGPDDFFVIQKDDGTVQHFVGGVRTQVLDLNVTFDAERGLLGIALHPDFGKGMGKDWVYLYYTASPAMADVTGGSPHNQVDRYTWNGSTLESGSRLPLLTLPGANGTHNGGALAFGPDGKLYGVIGDQNEDGQLQNQASGAPDDTGIIFRIDEDGAAPSDNPFAAITGMERVFAYGIRNSFGLSFDPETGELWETENGPETMDEINRYPAGSNGGWNQIMGPDALDPQNVSDLHTFPPATSMYVDPVYSIEDTVAVTGLAFASTNSSLGPSNVGKLFVADYLNGQIYRFTLDAARHGFAVADKVANNQSELDGFRVASGFDAGITQLLEGPDGDLYVVAFGQNAIYRIVGSGGPAVHDLAVASVKAPKRVTLSAAKPVATGSVTATIVNQGNNPETIANDTELGQLVTLDVTPLTVGCPDPPPMTLVPPKQGFPLELGPRKKLKLVFQLSFDCATESPAEFQYQVSLDHEGVFGDPDADPADDVCPRAPSSGDKGCGGKTGGPIQTDVLMK